MKICIHSSCTRQRTFNVEGKSPAYCRPHAEDGMVDVRNRRCSHASCRRTPYFNVEGSKRGEYCRQHAQDDMVDVLSRRCSHGNCTIVPTFNIQGSKRGEYCKQHATGGMINVRKSRCTRNSCNTWPTWGVLSSRAATACTRHKGDVLGAPVISFVSSCNAAGCKKVSRWGLHGKQPTHCGDHGPFEDGLVCTIGRACRKDMCSRPSYHSARGPSHNVKIECNF